MPTVKVPLATGVYRNIDQTELKDEAYELMDCYVNERGSVVRRPACVQKIVQDASYGGCIGLYWWPVKGYALGVHSASNVVVRYTPSTPDSYTGLALSTISGTAYRPTFCDDGTSAFVARGGPIYYSNGSANFAAIADADAPILVTHVTWLDGYLIANSVGTNRFYYSAVADSATWDSEFASASGSSDNILALKAHNRQLFLFGTVSLEVWENNGESPFERVPGGFIESGCSAPYSIVTTEDDIFWLDQARRLVKWSGGRVERVSTPFDREIADFSQVDDCFAYHTAFGGKDFLVLQFPAEARTLVHNLTNKTWSEWGRWDSTRGEYDRFIGDAHCFNLTHGKHMIGSYRGPDIQHLEEDVFRDSDYQASNSLARIRSLQTTGHIDYGTSKRKLSKELRLVLKRGNADSSIDAGEPGMQLRYRDNGSTDWSNWRQINLGGPGGTKRIVRLQRQGVFETRQYQFACSDDCGWNLIDAEEDIEVLR